MNPNSDNDNESQGSRRRFHTKNFDMTICAKDRSAQAKLERPFTKLLKEPCKRSSVL